MKIKIYQLLGLCLLATASCNKSGDLKPGLVAVDSKRALASVSSGYPPLTVITLAGSVGGTGERYGYADGPGPQARFSFPMGIEMMLDGTLYIADSFNKKIRKITTGNIVSTVNTPAISNGIEFDMPRSVRVTPDGTMYVLQNGGGDYGHKFWIFKPNGEIIIPPYHNEDYQYADIVKNPYTSYLSLTGLKPVYKNGRLNDYRGLIEKALLGDDGVLGKDQYVISQSSLTPTDQMTPYVSTMFCGYNNVKYLAIGKNIYKLTPSGVFFRINPESIKFTISHIVANKDSRTLYITCDNGAIYSISNGKLTYLVGPNGTQNGVDGVGKAADVYALDIVLSKDEGTLYFTDSNNHSVRKLLLR